MKKRKLIALFLVVILIFAMVAGCSKETDEKEDPKPTATPDSDSEVVEEEIPE